jgi:hypothetical protein
MSLVVRDALGLDEPGISRPLVASVLGQGRLRDRHAAAQESQHGDEGGGKPNAGLPAEHGEQVLSAVSTFVHL